MKNLIILSLIGASLLNYYQPLPKEACIETHQTLNRAETQQLCGKIVSLT